MSKVYDAYEELRDAQQELQVAQQQPQPCSEDDGYANPDDSVDRLGRLFSKLRLKERYGIMFSRYLDLVRRGDWENYAHERS